MLTGDNAAVSIAKLQVVSGKSFNGVSLPRQLFKKLQQGNRGGGSKDDVVVSFFCILVCDRITVGQRNGSRHCQKPAGSRSLKAPSRSSWLAEEYFINTQGVALRLLRNLPKPHKPHEAHTDQSRPRTKVDGHWNPRPADDGGNSGASPPQAVFAMGDGTGQLYISTVGSHDFKGFHFPP
jgi:hypothetical protein